MLSLIWTQTGKGGIVIAAADVGLVANMNNDNNCSSCDSLGHVINNMFVDRKFSYSFYMKYISYQGSS